LFAGSSAASSSATAGGFWPAPLRTGFGRRFKGSDQRGEFDIADLLDLALLALLIPFLLRLGEALREFGGFLLGINQKNPIRPGAFAIPPIAHQRESNLPLRQAEIVGEFDPELLFLFGEDFSFRRVTNFSRNSFMASSPQSLTREARLKVFFALLMSGTVIKASVSAGSSFSGDGTAAETLLPHQPHKARIAMVRPD